MNTATIDRPRYARLVGKAAPMIVTTETENDRLLGIVEKLLDKGEDKLTPEEGALLELLTKLIEEFEGKAYPDVFNSDLKPGQMAAYLLGQRGQKASDLWPVIGSKSRVSDILSGKREPSKEQAKKLAAFFGVGVEAFL